LEKGWGKAIWKKRVLVSDDSHGILMTLSALLGRMGFDVIPATDGMEALRRARMMRPDLILLSLQMPVVDGLSTLKALKENAETRRIPVVMLSSERSAAPLEECRRLGSAGCLMKPLDVECLHDVLEENLFAPRGHRRMHVRTPYSEPVMISASGLKRTLEARSLSEVGMYLVTSEPLPVGSGLEVTFPRPDAPLTLPGTVAYVNIHAGDGRRPAGMAVEFKGLRRKDREDLSRFIQELLTSRSSGEHL
jgi:CheY-like chemotaxis protein